MAIEQISKAEFARMLGVSKPRISQYVSMGLPVLSDGTLDKALSERWVKSNIALKGKRWQGRGRWKLAGLEHGSSF